MEKSIPHKGAELQGKRRGPKKSLGQHFLKDPSVIRGIAELVRPEPNDFLIEIGPGRGEITLPILSEINTGGFSESVRYTALEKDELLAGALSEKAANAGFSSFFDILEGDALENLPKIAGKKKEHLKIFGNIPYYLTGKLFRTIFDLPVYPTRAVFMVQEEVAERIAAGPREMNRLSAFVRFWGVPAIALKVPKSSFSPKPKVDSAVVVIEQSPGTEMLPEHTREAYEMFVKNLFAQPRKTAENNLSPIFGGKTEGKKRAQEFLHKLGMRENARPQDFDAETLIRAARLLYNKLDGTQKK